MSREHVDDIRPDAEGVVAPQENIACSPAGDADGAGADAADAAGGADDVRCSIVLNGGYVLLEGMTDIDEAAAFAASLYEALYQRSRPHAPTPAAHAAGAAGGRLRARATDREAARTHPARPRASGLAERQ
ncbi:MAG: hypothetical protein ACTH31_01965 [Pseudoclavibacter sp.]